jgi:HlyD family secretion protein
MQSFKSRRAIWVTGTVVLAVAAAALFFYWRRTGAAEFMTQPVERGPIRNVVNATGTVQALLTVQVGSQVTGQVQALHADYNSIVRQGQLLAEIDARRFQAELSAAQANLLAAQARVHSAEAELNSQIANRQSAQANVEAARVARDNAAKVLGRYEELRQGGILSQNDYDNAKANADSTAAKYNQAVAQAEQVEAQTSAARAQVEQSKAQVEQAEAALEQARVNLEYTTIYSPVDGVVISRNVDVGQTVAASLSAPTLFVIANDLAKMQVHASVDEADIGSISRDADVRFTVDAYPNRTFAAKIGEIRLEPQTVQNVVTYSVIIDVDNDRLELKPGMTANIAITVAQLDDALKIPNTALRYLPPGTTREQAAKMLPSQPAEGASFTRKAPADAGDGASPGGRRRDELASKGSSKETGKETGKGAGQAVSRGGARTDAPELAPGQMWDPAKKIQFPEQDRQVTHPGIVWILGAPGKPEPRRVLLGITDGTSTQLISGEVNEGDQVIVGDTVQAAASGTAGASPAQGPGGGRFIFGGPR